MITRDALHAETGAERGFVINDFAAAAWVTADAPPLDVSLIAGAPDFPTGTRVVIDPGTGLGTGALVFDGARYHSIPE